VFHDESKHIEIRYHFTHDMMQRGAIKLQYVDTDEQVGTPTQAGMLPQRRLVLQRRLVCYPSTGWYATPAQAGILPQCRLVCYSNEGWYATPVKMLMILCSPKGPPSKGGVV
jgi:hypothetical protein